MLMVHIGSMSMSMGDRRMRVPMAVATDGHHIMGVRVVPVVMAVGVLMFQGFVRMFMPMAFSQVQEHSGQHEATPQHHEPAR